MVAHLYTEFFEELALETAPTRPRLWKRYVDDTLCILRKGSTEELLHHLNGVRPTIKFTVEQEEDGTLPLRWCRTSSVEPFLRMQKVSSTYLFHSLGLVGAISSAVIQCQLLKELHVEVGHHST